MLSQRAPQKPGALWLSGVLRLRDIVDAGAVLGLLAADSGVLQAAHDDRKLGGRAANPECRTLVPAHDVAWLAGNGATDDDIDALLGRSIASMLDAAACMVPSPDQWL